MMAIVEAIKSFFQALGGLFRYLADSQLIDAGRAQELLDAIDQSKHRQEVADEARNRDLPSDLDSLLDEL